MFKIKALNQESSSDEDVPSIRREAQEEIVLELYNNALRAQVQKKIDDSENILTKLIEDNIPQLENNGGLPKSMSTLKYSCYVNLGNIYLSQNNVNKALECFINASELDSKDVTLWTKIGKLSLKENKFNKAAYAFSKGLECSESHWPCLDNLISVLYAIKDTVSCLVYIGKALMLDGDYTKGLVLRKQIFKDNPATRDYYKLYNPDHIWEPSLDTEIDPEEEEEILREAQSLCDRLTEVERTLGPKPLETIPLPKALTEYTWISLAETVAYCHNYIRDNKMSHFTILDMSKCMSQSEIKDTVKLTEDVNVVLDNKGDIKTIENQEEGPSSLEKMETSSLLTERRFSQTSENTNGNDINPENMTPVQTDNDEEQNMELDIDNETDGDIQGDNIDVNNQRRKGKRKRDVLSDLQIWGWHSKRKQPKKSNKDFTVQDALNRIIPKSLLKNKITSDILNPTDEDSMNTMDIYNMYVENKEFTFLSPIHSPKSVNFEAYFGTDRERDDVLNFWIKERDRIDSIVLVKELVFELGRLWQYKWPKDLVPLYIELFQMFREHCDQPQVFCSETTFEQIKDDALSTLLYGELVSFTTESNENIHPSILSYLQIVSTWTEHWGQDTSFFIRFYWLQSHCFRKSDENALAIRALEAILGEIVENNIESPDKFSLSLPNCIKYGFITKQIIDKIIKHLNMIISLGCIENLFNMQKYSEVAEILKQTFHSGSYSKVGRMGRPAQLGILMHALWFINWEECFIWTEECLNEALQNYSKPNADQEKWVKIMDKCLGIFLEIIKKETVSIIDKLAEDKRCRLVECLSKIICKQLNSDNDPSMTLGCINPWILLHYILLREEHRQYARIKLNQAKRDRSDPTQEDIPEILPEDELPPSLSILCSAHEFLGPKGLCLAGNGELLHFILDISLDRLDTPLFEPFRDKIDIHIEQALFCLYLYPSKKTKISRHLVDHNVNPIPLSWERSFQLYQYYAPDRLPEFNSYKSQSISSDLEQLFKRIIGLVPSICALHDQLPKIMDFIHGKTEILPEPVDFPNRIRAIYYLLGDYYFKEKEFARCIKYFHLDLCINPARLDSWASLALSYAAQLENTLNYCEKFKNESDFFEKAKSAQMCFKKALELDPDNLVLWIECGSFEYMVHSFCSRLIKFESESFNMEKFELLESEKESYLDSSGQSLERAISIYEVDESNEPDERWLQYYILGKIAEKKRKEPSEYLQYYLTASTLLHENKATYPEKINYNNPQHLSVEALELHYRIHASVLKYLELHEGKDISNTLGVFFKKCLNTTATYFVAPPTHPIQKPTENSASQSFQDQFLNSIKGFNTNEIKITPNNADNSTEIVKECLENILNKVDEIITERNVNSNLKKNDAEETKTTMQNAQKDIDEEQSADLDVTIIEEDDVIMIISDSEEETPKNVEEINNPEEGTTLSEIKIKPDDLEMNVDNKGNLQDVQSLLDKMMEQTMKDRDKQDESDPNNSSTEQIEEVILKEDTPSIVKDGLIEAQVTEQVKIGGPSKIDENTKCSKSKPSDSETDTDNKKTAEDDSSSSSSSSSSDSSSSDSDSDESDSSSSTSSSDTLNENMSSSEILQLVDKCVNGLEICVSRLPQNYKALYRLAHLFFNYKGRKDYTKCKQLLLGEYKCKDGTVVTGLFSERKTTNFFNGIWRIPSTEIDRPGSLAAHMNRCISLVLQVLRNTNDTKTLMELCMQLRKVPDRDKIYIKDSDRKAFSEQAMSMCVQSFKGQIKNILNMQNTQIVKLLHDLFKIFQRVQKHIPTKESCFSNLLVDVYKQFVKEKIPENVNVLDLAIKFCQQHKLSDKNKITGNNANVSFVRSPGVASSPVHPPPSTLVSSQKALKPPSVGRPRGRPPLPKIPGQGRQPRAKGPGSSNVGSYPWQNPMFTGSNFNYEYLKHYQDELIKQYSQNLSISQLSQLTQFITSGQLNPAMVQPNQFLSQSNLINSASNLLRPNMSSIGTGAIPSSASSFMDPGGIKGFNPQLSSSLANLSAEQMKFLESMLPNIPKPNSNSKSTATGAKTSGNQNLTALKSNPNSGSLKSTNLKSSSAITKSSSDIHKMKTISIDKSPTKTFKEPSHIKPHLPSMVHEDKSTNMLIKDRPNLSITPVGSLSVTSVSNSYQSAPTAGVSALSAITTTAFPKPTPLPAVHTSSNISKQIPSSSYSLPKPFPKTVASFTKPSPIPVSLPNSSGLKQVPTAHSSSSPNPVYSLPNTPPPVSSPSFIKTGIATSPGKTLQEKLADKKKEQETKQLMKNIEAEIFAANIPSTPTTLLKGLNIPNIPSSLSVSPSTSNAPINPYPLNSPLGMDKHNVMPKYQGVKNASHGLGLTVEHKIPSSLTVSKSVPSAAYPPRFAPDSGVSRVSSSKKHKSKSLEKHSKPPVLGASIPISLDKSVDISTVSSKNSSKFSGSSKNPVKSSSTHKVIETTKQIRNNSPKDKSKPTISVKKDLYDKYSRSKNEVIHKQQNILVNKPNNEKNIEISHSSKKKINVEKNALSVIQNLSSIDIRPISSTSKELNTPNTKEDIICIDSEED